MSFQGDDAGRWAWDVISATHGTVCADINIFTPIPSHQLTEFEREALSSGDGLGAFEPGPDGETPSLRVRRIGQDRAPLNSSDVKFIIADRLKAFDPSWGDDTSRVKLIDTWDTRLLFYEVLPETIDYRIRIGERPDELSRSVALAVARAAGREVALAETYNFDPEVIRPELISQQSRVEWLVLVSRNPVYRAVQACSDVVTLLDFSSRIEAARPVHVCVSIGKDRYDQCVGALRRSSRSLLKGEFLSPSRLLERARSLAPGLALRALASEEIALEGLLGLLLTEHEMRKAGHLVLSLDQHAQLLSGSGVLADLIALSVSEDRRSIRVDIGEAKFTLGDVIPTGQQIVRATRQLTSTVDRLQRFGVTHSLSARTRAALARAAVQQIHLLDRSIGEAEHKSLLAIPDALRDRQSTVYITSVAEAVVHVWSVSSSTRDATGTNPGPRVVIHGREFTLRRLGDL